MALAIPSQAGAGRVIHGGLRGLAVAALTGGAAATQTTESGVVIAAVITGACSLLAVIIPWLLSRARRTAHGELADELGQLRADNHDLRTDNDRLRHELDQRRRR